MCRWLASANSMGFDESRRFPVNSNQFQPLLKKLLWPIKLNQGSFRTGNGVKNRAQAEAEAEGVETGLSA